MLMRCIWGVRDDTNGFSGFCIRCGSHDRIHIFKAALYRKILGSGDDLRVFCLVCCSLRRIHGEQRGAECRLFFLGQFDLAVFLFSKQFVDLVYPQRDIDGFDDGDRNHREFSFAVLCKGLCRIYV